MIKVYSQKDCPNCDIIKDYLNNKNIQFENIDVNEEFESYALLLMNNIESTPAVYIDNEFYSGNTEYLTEKVNNYITM